MNKVLTSSKIITTLCTFVICCVSAIIVAWKGLYDVAPLMLLEQFPYMVVKLADIIVGDIIITKYFGKNQAYHLLICFASIILSVSVLTLTINLTNKIGLPSSFMISIGVELLYYVIFMIVLLIKLTQPI